MKNETKNLFKAAGIYVALIAIIFGGIELTTTVYGNIRNKVICRKFWKDLGPKGRNDLRIAWADCGRIPMEFCEYLMTKMYGPFVIDISGDKKQKTLIMVDCLKKHLNEPLEVV